MVETITKSRCAVCGYVNHGVFLWKATVLRRVVKLSKGLGSRGPHRCQECGRPAGWDQAVITLTPESRLAVAAEKFRRWPT